MANDSYSVSSGASLYAGITPPSSLFLPAPGTVADISLNTLFDVRGDTHPGAMQVMSAWCGAAWAPWWGTHGSLVFTGGGHVISTTVPDGNAVYRYDVGSRLFTQIKPAARHYFKSNGYIADTASGWLWANATDGDTTVQVGEPFPSHTYAFLLALPPSAMPGGATNGWLYTPGNGTMSKGGQQSTGQGKKLRMGIDTAWTQQGPADAPFTSNNTFAVYDSLRNRVWACKQQLISNLTWRDLTLGTWGTMGVSIAGGSVYGNYCVGDYDAANDLLMWVRAYASPTEPDFVLHIVNLSTGAGYKINCDSGAPADLSGAWCWSEAWRCWIYYPGRGDNTVYFLKQPADPVAGTWTWSSQTFTGTARSYNISQGAGIPFNRLRHIPSLNLLLWPSQSNMPVQGIRLTEAP